MSITVIYHAMSLDCTVSTFALFKLFAYTLIYCRQYFVAN